MQCLTAAAAAAARSDSFCELLQTLPKLAHRPAVIMVENVQGFEHSEMRRRVVECLTEAVEPPYSLEEFLLDPRQLGLPNARLRSAPAP